MSDGQRGNSSIPYSDIRAITPPPAALLGVVQSLAVQRDRLNHNPMKDTPRTQMGWPFYTMFSLLAVPMVIFAKTAFVSDQTNPVMEVVVVRSREFRV